MTWKVIGCFQRDFIPLCISRVSGFTIKGHRPFMKAHIVNWGGEGNSHKSLIAELSCILWWVLFSQKELLELRRLGMANTAMGQLCQLQPCAIAFTQGELGSSPLHAPSHSSSAQQPQQIFQQGSGPEAGINPEIWGLSSARCLTWQAGACE